MTENRTRSPTDWTYLLKVLRDEGVIHRDGLDIAMRSDNTITLVMHNFSSKIVAMIHRSSDKCYRLMYHSKSYRKDRRGLDKQVYNSFRNQRELAIELRDLFFEDCKFYLY